MQPQAEKRANGNWFMWQWFSPWFRGTWANRLTTRLFGNAGEAVAERFLKRQGYKILERQYRSRLGEIDLIALDRSESRGGCVVFVEVKTRRSDSAGRPEDAVTLAKQRQLTRLALEYLKRQGWLHGRRCRFDVVAITWPAQGEVPDIVHFPHAFEAVGTRGMFS